MEKIICILKKPSEYRKSRDVNLLLPILHKIGQSKLDNFSARDLQFMAQELQYSSYEANDEIIECSNSFCYILQGSVTVHSFTKNGQINFEEGKRFEANEIFGESLSEQLQTEFPLSLIKSNCAAIANEETHIAFLNKSIYSKALKLIYERNLDDSIDFLKSIPLFSKWTYHTLLKLHSCFTTRNYIRNSIVYKVGTPANKVYIVKSGKFEVGFRLSYEKQHKLDCTAFLNQKKPFSARYSTLFIEKLLKRPAIIKDCSVLLNIRIG